MTKYSDVKVTVNQEEFAKISALAANALSTNWASEPVGTSPLWAFSPITTAPPDWAAIIANGIRDAVLGISSQLPEKKHILMWDFDNSTKDAAIAALRKQQKFVPTGPIALVKTRADGLHWHGYSFNDCTLDGLIYIAKRTTGVDPKFIKMIQLNEFAVLRITSKNGEELHIEEVLPSKVKAQAEVADLLYIRAYSVKEDGAGSYTAALNFSIPTYKLTEATNFLWDLQTALGGMK